MAIVDRLSKRSHFIPTTKTLTSQGAAQLYLDNVFKHHGIPQHITSDKDIRFMANFWHTIHKALGTELLFTTTNHPAADGQSERMMRVLNQLLRSYCDEYYNKWDTLLAVVEFAYNTTYQKSIDDVPFRIDYGYIPTGPAYASTWSEERFSPSAEQLQTTLKTIQRREVGS
ncbi:unnamed protein product [Ambrosiozyma monospora]|uniref:Unnamed protein product n=1 Tax=Ambrosiozyma monospora TaxID=43982 RepID=A0A9W7DI25_AMBMO|nr:unnamed protein product [Ambrosiozyma monospora]